MKLLSINDRESNDVAAYIGDDDRIKVSANGVTIDLADLLRGLPAKFFDGAQVKHLDEHDGFRLNLLFRELGS